MAVVKTKIKIGVTKRIGVSTRVAHQRTEIGTGRKVPAQSKYFLFVLAVIVFFLFFYYVFFLFLL